MAGRFMRSQRIESWGQPLRIIFLDYVEVGRDIATGIRRSPLKALVYGFMAGILGTSWRRNPDMASFVNNVLEYSNELSMCGETERNPAALAHIERLISLNSDGYLRRINLGVCSVVMQRVSSPQCCGYHEVCPHLQPRVWHAYQRILDIGVWGRWLLLERNMVDFDINEKQLEKSLAELNS